MELFEPFLQCSTAQRRSADRLVEAIGGFADIKIEIAIALNEARILSKPSQAWLAIPATIASMEIIFFTLGYSFFERSNEKAFGIAEGLVTRKTKPAVLMR